ncbi:E4 SUMO-protein ligase PIAL2 [Sesamum angolense]|uniref:E4 SUMO-protein ligase PIAL2 n=1 Tax=Sesamum angolense TaxID=2727404 RepID=A0AAE1WWF5_9LAMI|nr:E4 SUMO-protein ligase PIAL2 [Sesamum angolense]
MAGTAVTPAPANGVSLDAGVGGSGGGEALTNGLKPSDLNAFRISAVIDRLSLHVHSHQKNDGVEFLNLCLSLASFYGVWGLCTGVIGLAEMVLIHVLSIQSCMTLLKLSVSSLTCSIQDWGLEVLILPLRTMTFHTDLKSCLHLKKVCQNKNDALLQAAIMVLMISVKSACQSGWFSDTDSKELSDLANEIASNYGSVSNVNTEPSCSLPVISTIISRFYPKLKMGHIFAFLEVKPGYEAYVSDFQISKNLKSSPGDKIRLFVVQTDSIETSSCLISPPRVNFLLNGKGVEKRNNIFMDTGPQVPTVVTHFLKYGSNLLQAVGDFNGNYIIAVAFMSDMPNPSGNVLQDYEQQVPATVDSDSEVIVGPSRISLNCPISFRRIKTPVKGHSCKHIQCFDFDNYVDINSRRPSWRCPHCNQHVCFTDIRVDQQMILKEAGPNVSNIVVSSDGSWNAVMEEDALAKLKIEKHFSDADRQFMDQTKAINPHMANTNDVNQSSTHVATDFRSGIYTPTVGLGLPSNVRLNPEIAACPVSTSVLTHPFTSPSQEVEAFRGHALVTASASQSGTSLPNTSQLQQYQFGNPSITNEYGRFPLVPRHVSRTPIAVQALPAQTPTSVLQQSSRNSVSAFTQNGLSAASPFSPSVPNSSTPFRANTHQVSQMASSPMVQRPSIQQNRPFLSARPPHQNAGPQNLNQIPNAYRVSNEHHSSSQQMVSPRVLRRMRQSPGLNQSSMQSSGSFLHSQQAQLIAAANRTMQMAIGEPSISPSSSRNPDGRSMLSLGNQMGNIGVTSPPLTRTDTYDPSDVNWRPAGRMRGALSGQAYTDALNQFIIRPTQQAEAARPVPNLTSLPTNVQSNLQASVAGEAVQVTPAQNYPSAGPASSPVVPETFPDGSSANN